jgi:hypothetical protein
MMSLDDYKKEVEILEEQFRLQKQKIAREYALGTAKFIPGDIIKDSVSIIEIKKIKWQYSLYAPIVVYEGVELKKDLTPKKDGSIRCIFGNGHSNNPVELVKKKV